jgi:hypothetical protein
MKVSIPTLCSTLTILSLTACGFTSEHTLETKQSEPTINEALPRMAQAITTVEKEIFTNFIYEVGPRFGPIKKDLVKKARTIDAFFDEEQLQAMMSLKSVSIILIMDDEQSDIRATGYSKKLTNAQLKLLQSSDYATSFLVRAEFLQKNENTGELEDSYASPHLTIVPEQQATYSNGITALKAYLKENTEDVREDVDPDKLRPAKLFFTVTTNGSIENVRLDRTSGYPAVDERMIKLIKKAPGAWYPAETKNGEKVNQELVVSFGLMGC